ncbi:MAG: hypothetical protein NTY76_01465 [Candidatus Omnitrophica bacterium]|nr:hypothetical protein [Candidatus Omnitrophota bacterium]
MKFHFGKQAHLIFFSLAAMVIFILPCAGDDYKYDSHGKRDPFVPLVSIDRPAVSRLEDVTSVADVKLEGVASTPRGKIAAILNGEIVKEGDKFGDIEIKKITKKTVTIIMGGKNYNIDLAEEGGTKSGL